MNNSQQKRSSWGHPRDLLWFVGCITLIGVAAAMHWQGLDVTYVLACLAFLFIGSIVVIWRNWKHRAEPGSAKLGQVAALPRSWRPWVLGEDKNNKHARSTPNCSFKPAVHWLRQRSAAQLKRFSSNAVGLDTVGLGRRLMSHQQS